MYEAKKMADHILSFRFISRTALSSVHNCRLPKCLQMLIIVDQLIKCLLCDRKLTTLPRQPFSFLFGHLLVLGLRMTHSDNKQTSKHLNQTKTIYTVLFSSHRFLHIKQAK